MEDLKTKINGGLTDLQKNQRLHFDFKTYDVFADEEVRQGIKEYSDWPDVIFLEKFE